MADSTTHLAQLEMSQAQKEVTANGLFDAASPATYGGRRAEACAGLTWGYYGGRFGGVTVANGTLTAPESDTSYVIMDRATGEILLADGGGSSSSDSQWDDTDAYARLYELTAGEATITEYDDHRFGPGGLFAYATPTGGLVIGTDVQAYDADLQTIAGLTATTDSFMQAKSSAWAARTVAQVSDDLQATGLVADAVGFRTIPQNSQSGAYTTVAADSGKHLLHPSADTTARTFTIDSNANVAYPIGTAITFVNQDSAGVLTIAITSDTMRLAGAGTTGSRTLAANGIATALKVTATEWIINGTGLT